jgi:hypothetical protein
MSTSLSLRHKTAIATHLVDSRVLRNKRLQTPSGPEGSSGSNPLCVPQGSLAINRLSAGEKMKKQTSDHALPAIHIL